MFQPNFPKQIASVTHQTGEYVGSKDSMDNLEHKRQLLLTGF